MLIKNWLELYENEGVEKFSTKKKNKYRNSSIIRAIKRTYKVGHFDILHISCVHACGYIIFE